MVKKKRPPLFSNASKTWVESGPNSVTSKSTKTKPTAPNARKAKQVMGEARCARTQKPAVGKKDFLHPRKVVWEPRSRTKRRKKERI